MPKWGREEKEKEYSILGNRSKTEDFGVGKWILENELVLEHCMSN